MVSKSENKKERSREHEKIVEYLMQENGENLQLLEPNLELFSIYIEPQSDSIEDILQFSSEIDRMEYLLSNDIEPVYKTRADISCFNENDNALVIIEIKSSSEKAYYKTFGQILYYLTIEKNNLNNVIPIKHTNRKDVKKLRGIILAKKRNIHDSLKLLIKEYEDVIPKIKLKTYYWNDKRELIIEDI